MVIFSISTLLVGSVTSGANEKLKCRVNFAGSPLLGRSVHGTALLFFSLSTAQIHIWKGLGGRGTRQYTPE